MKHKQKIRGFFEWSWIGSWREYYKWNAGAGKYIKKRLNKRVRKQGKLEVRE